jgi:hypothetical protein
MWKPTSGDGRAWCRIGNPAEQHDLGARQRCGYGSLCEAEVPLIINRPLNGSTLARRREAAEPPQLICRQRTVGDDLL